LPTAAASQPAGRARALAVTIGRRLGGPQTREISGDLRQRDSLLVGERLGACVVERDQLAALTLDRGERAFELALERAGDELQHE
jgi:hypothetical protein